MSKATKNQEIWKRAENGLKLVLPKKINSDIGWQLMFGYREDFRYEKEKYDKHCEQYETKIYKDVEDFKSHL